MSRVLELAITCLNDEHGISENTYNAFLYLLNQKERKLLSSYVEATDGKFYLPKNSPFITRKELERRNKMIVKILKLDDDSFEVDVETESNITSFVINKRSALTLKSDIFRALEEALLKQEFLERKVSLKKGD